MDAIKEYLQQNLILLVAIVLLLIIGCLYIIMVMKLFKFNEFEFFDSQSSSFFNTIIYKINAFFSEYLFLLPEFFLANSILILLLIGICFKKFHKNQFFFDFFILISKFIVFITGILVFLNFKYFNLFMKFLTGKNNVLVFWDQYSIDFFSLVFKILILVFFYFLLTLLRLYILHQRVYLFEYVILSFTALLGGFLMISSFDFLFFYLVLELQALSFYVLAALNVKSKFSAEAGIKYFFTGALASGLLLLGIGFLYGYTGTVNFYQLNLFFSMVNNNNLPPIRILIFSLLLILVALLIKLGVAPFHMWVPDVYQGSPLFVTALFATLPKISLFPVLLKFLFYIIGINIIGFYNSFLNLYNFVFIGYYGNLVSKILFIAGFFSVIVGSLGALGQASIKRFFAYSSIGNIGYIILVLGTNSVEGFQASIFYLFIYLVLSINFFAILFALRYTTKVSIVNLSDLAFVNSPYLLFLFSLNLFSLAGIPPLAGFFSKFYVFYSLFSAHYYFLAFGLSLLTIISTFYYIRIVAIIFFTLKKIIAVRTSSASVIKLITAKRLSISQRLPADLSILIFITSIFNVFIFFQLETFLVFLNKLILLFF